jgi:EAL domain-containing protein (putative c-di-GMP-specific phosphodiesterase class I)
MNRVNQAAVAESDLQRALDCGELIRLYQPIVDLATGTPLYVEALLRWDHPGRGLLAPHDFLVDEDDSALLVRIGWSVVIEAARRAGSWRRTYPGRPITVSVNLSAGHLGRRELPARVEHLLLDNEVPGPNALAFEISERNFLSNRLRARDRLTPLRNLGVEIVIDDFGATAAATGVGPSALRDSALELVESLGAFPLDVIKLDPRFVARLEGAAADVVAAAHAIDVRVVALAVEDEAGADRARDAGFDLAQGFHFHRPERPGYVDGLLAAR